MEHCSCYLGGEQIGKMYWRIESQQLLVEVQCPFEAGYIYRAILEHSAGELSLGVMLPEHGQFVLRRQISMSILPKTVYIDRTLPGEEHLPGLPLAWSAFKGDEHSGFRAVWKETEYIIVPFRMGEAHIYAHLMCLTTLLEYRGTLYGVLGRREEKYIAVSDILRESSVIW